MKRKKRRERKGKLTVTESDMTRMKELEKGESFEVEKFNLLHQHEEEKKREKNTKNLENEEEGKKRKNNKMKKKKERKRDREKKYEMDG